MVSLPEFQGAFTVFVSNHIGDAECILGRDFFQRYHCLIDVASRRLVFPPPAQSPPTDQQTQAADAAQTAPAVVSPSPGRGQQPAPSEQTDPPCPPADENGGPAADTAAPLAVCRVVVREDWSVPPGAECLIEGFAEDTTFAGPAFLDGDGTADLMTVPAVVEVKPGQPLPVMIQNISPHYATVYRKQQIGSLNPDFHLVEKSEERVEVCAVSAQTEVKQPPVDIPAELTESQQVQAAQLLSNYAHLFDGRVGLTTLVQHTIPTGDHPPIRQAPRRIPPHLRDEVKAQIDDLVNKGILEESDGAWASPVVLVRKRGGAGLRICADMRKVNSITQVPAYPVARVDDVLESLAGSSMFCILDLKSGYNQMEVAPEDRDKTAICLPWGLYAWRRCSYGLAGAPSSFARLLNIVLDGLAPKECLAYFDDIIVHGNSVSQVLQRLERVLERLSSAGLTLNPAKCQLFRPVVTYLGHRVSKDGIGPDPEKVQKVVDWRTPRSKKELLSFLGLAGYFRRYLATFAKTAAPLTQLTQKHVPFHWSPEAETAFTKLKDMLTSAPVVALPRFEDDAAPFILDTDASDSGIGACLLQVQDGGERVISFASATLTKSQKNYSVTKRELLAVVTFVTHFRHFLLGRKFVLRTDHSSLQWLLNFRDPQGMLARWLETLGNFQFSVVHRPGLAHGDADGMSRMPPPTQEVACQTDCDTDYGHVPSKAHHSSHHKTGVKAVQTVPTPGTIAAAAGGTQTATATAAAAAAQDTSAPPLPTGFPFSPLRNESLTASPPSLPGRSATATSAGADALPRPSVSALNVAPGATPDHSQPERGDRPADRGNAPPHPPQHTVTGQGHRLPTVTSWPNDFLLGEQLKDPAISVAIKWAETQNKPPQPPADPRERALWRQSDRLQLSEGLLCRAVHTGMSNSTELQIVLPIQLVNGVLEAFHAGPSGGHFNARKLTKTIQRRFWSPGLGAAAAAFCENCERCSTRNAPTPKPRAAMGNLVAKAPLEKVAIDLLTHLPETEDGYKHLLVVVDHFTKWVEVYPLKTQEAGEVAAVLVNEFISRWGVPQSFHSDQGANFCGTVFKEMCRLLGIDKTQTSPGWPAGNGVCERVNRVILDMLARYLDQNHRAWKEHLPLLLLGYRSAVHDSTGFSPYLLMMGREPRLPAEAEMGVPAQTGEGTLSEYIDHLCQGLLAAYDVARRRTEAATTANRDRYGQKLNAYHYQAGDAVYLFRKVPARGEYHKFVRPWKPAVVLGQTGELNYRIQMCSGRRRKLVVHHNRLKPRKADSAQSPTPPAAQPTQTAPAVTPPSQPATAEQTRAPPAGPSDRPPTAEPQLQAAEPAEPLLCLPTAQRPGSVESVSQPEAANPVPVTDEPATPAEPDRRQARRSFIPRPSPLSPGDTVTAEPRLSPAPHPNAPQSRIPVATSRTGPRDHGERRSERVRRPPDRFRPADLR